MKRMLIATALLSAIPGNGGAQSSHQPGSSPTSIVAAPRAGEETAIDSERLALARTAAARLLPEGSYERILQSSMTTVADVIVGQMFNARMRDIAPEGSAPDREIEQEVGDKTLREVLAEQDPHFEERMRITNRVMMEAMVPIMTGLEPEMREGLARAYARRFTPQQLSDMNRFFATPSGSSFAADSLMIWMDPEITSLMGRMMPAIMQEMPSIMEKTKAATAHLPLPPDSKGKRGSRR